MTQENKGHDTSPAAQEGGCWQTCRVPSQDAGGAGLVWVALVHLLSLPRAQPSQVLPLSQELRLGSRGRGEVDLEVSSPRV